VRVVALVPDMMDRSRIASAVAGVEFIEAADAGSSADVVIIDLGRRGTDVARARASAPSARIVAYGPHVDDEAFDRARRDGADLVLPRSRFFRDIGGALA
jgi:DNA-binding NarL/FixJ family response regulator